jgi:hypothetical protein
MNSLSGLILEIYDSRDALKNLTPVEKLEVDKILTNTAMLLSTTIRRPVYYNQVNTQTYFRRSHDYRDGSSS